MTKARGYILFFISILILLVEANYLIVQPLISRVNFQVTNSQYWALAVPMAGIVLVMSITTMWIGFTMVRSPQPVKFTYDEAYEIAVEEESSSSE